MPTSALDRHRLLRLLETGRHLVARLDLDGVLAQLLEIARELTGARYAAIGVLDEERRGLERFLTAGIDEEAREAIGDLPHGRGVLGVLIDDPRPLRLPDVGRHPRSYGFPAAHPPMTTFLGVPIVVRGRAWGNLYLTDKPEEFDEGDEEAIVVLSDWAAIAIENARLYEHAEAQRLSLEQAVEGLEATTAIARAVGTETDLGRVLELIVKRGRALVAARALVLLLLQDDAGLVHAASAGQVDAGAVGSRMAVPGTVAGAVLSSGRPERIADVGARMGIADEGFGVVGAETALIVPLVSRGRPLGVLAAFDRLEDDPGFGDREEGLLLAFAASAATAVSTARSVEQERLRHSLRSAEQERRRWARELHDETLQGLGGLRVLLASALRQESAGLEATVRTAVDQLASEIGNLRALITELRPAALDDLGLEPALESLVERIRTVEGLEVTLDVRLGERTRLDADAETAVYRLVQEALTNIAKHAQAERVAVRVDRETGGGVELVVTDDGRGFDPAAPADGFGVVGMRERAELLGGTLELRSAPGEGTTVRARLPAGTGAEPGLRGS